MFNSPLSDEFDQIIPLGPKVAPSQWSCSRNSTRFGVLITHINGTYTGTIFWVPSPWGLGVGSKIKFSEHGHVAYQIKGDDQ